MRQGCRPRAEGRRVNSKKSCPIKDNSKPVADGTTMKAVPVLQKKKGKESPPKARTSSSLASPSSPSRDGGGSRRHVQTVRCGGEERDTLFAPVVVAAAAQNPDDIVQALSVEEAFERLPPSSSSSRSKLHPPSDPDEDLESPLVAKTDRSFQGQQHRKAADEQQRQRRAPPPPAHSAASCIKRDSVPVVTRRQQLLDATALLKQLARDKGALDKELSPEEKAAFLNATGWVLRGHRNYRHHQYRSVRNQRRLLAADRKALENTGIRRLRDLPVYVTPSPGASPSSPQQQLLSSSSSSTGTKGGTSTVLARVDEDDKERKERPTEIQREASSKVSVGNADTPAQNTKCKRECYVCKKYFTSIHHFYDKLCPDNHGCAPLNFRKRGEMADLSGKVALLTGGRVKIGYQAAIKLLRCGARLIVTTRFPRDAAARYAAESDFEAWSSRLQIFGLDLRHTPSVEAFARFVLDRYERLDFIVNNAAQTIRRPPAFYEHMMVGERAPFGSLAPESRKLLTAYEVDLPQSLRGYDHKNNPVPLPLGPPQVHRGGRGGGSTVDPFASTAAKSVRIESTASASLTPERTPLAPAESSDSNATAVPIAATATSRALAVSPLSSSSPAASASSPSSVYLSSLSTSFSSPEPNLCFVGLSRPAELSQMPLLGEDHVGLPSSSAEHPSSRSSSCLAATTAKTTTATSAFPIGQLDQDLQQVDLRDSNSWVLKLHQVSTVELLETQLINAVAPFIINARLKPLMKATAGAHKHIVNVSAMEGQFYRNKTVNHPHTNMAKAALNMMTRTSAPDYFASGIHMNSVDTGWVTDENPAVKPRTPTRRMAAPSKTRLLGNSSAGGINAAQYQQQLERGPHKNVRSRGSGCYSSGDDDGDRYGAHYADDWRNQPPLDIVDGAARVLDPIINGVNTGIHQWGQFLKDYRPAFW